MTTILLLAAIAAHARAQTLGIGQYAHTAWRTRDGFGNSGVTAIAQTPDGYLWLGTSTGLLRFEGVRAEGWQPPRGLRLPSDEINALLVSRDSTVWIGTMKGLVSWKSGRLVEYAALKGRGIGQLLQAGDGTVWVSTYGPAQICAIDARHALCDRDASFEFAAPALFEDRRGRLRAASAKRLWEWSRNALSRTSVPMTSGGEAGDMAEAADGTLLVATASGLKAVTDTRVRDASFPGVSPPIRASRLLRSRDGALWLGSHSGILHVHGRRSERFDMSEGLSAGEITALFEDAEGNVWVGTSGGLDRFRAPRIPTISSEEGLPTTALWGIQSAPDGSVWIAGPHSLSRWMTDKIEDFSLGDESVSMRALGLNGHGRPVIATDKTVYSAHGRLFHPIRGVPGGNIFVIAADARGSLWILDGNKGLFRLGVDSIVVPLAVGSPDHIPVTMLPDEATGGVWVGFFQGGISLISPNGRVTKSYTASNGLGRGRVVDLRRGGDGAVWIATESGLSRLAGDRVATLARRNGLPCDGVNWAIEDDDRDLWLYTACGLVRIVRDESEAWKQNTERTIAVTIFDLSDGVPLMPSIGSIGPHVSKAPDGRIWFVSPTGASVIDPPALRVSRAPPPVRIERILADGATYRVSDSATPVRLPARIRNLSIDYAAISLATPEKVRVRFRLEPQDTAWREVVGQRSVEYSNLPPGQYRFHLTAGYGNGAWNPREAALDFSIAPAFVQTAWFRALLAAVMAALVGLLHRLRTRQLHRREARLEETIESMPALAFIAAPNGDRTFCNRQWTSYTGLSQVQAGGMGWRAAVHPDDLAAVVAKWRVHVETGTPLEYELRLRGADGDYRWFLTRAVPIRDGGGRVARWYGVATDIEDRRRAEQERERLRQLEAELAHVNRVSIMGELAASLAHEIRQPIAATMLNANVTLRSLDREPPDLDKLRDVARRILRDSGRANEIITRIRSLYRKTPPKREMVRLEDVIHEVVSLLQSEARRHAVSVRIELRDAPLLTIGDRVQLQQVFMNLMLNGIEAMGDAGGGELVVGARGQPPDDLLLSVRDSGAGLPTADPEQLFAPFFTTKAHGSGMGLSICRTIIESHGGRLRATPNDLKGATFEFTLHRASGIH